MQLRRYEDSLAAVSSVPREPQLAVHGTIILNIPVEITPRMARINHYELGGTTIPPSITPLERVELDTMDFEVGGPGDVPEPTRPAKWALVEPRLSKETPKISKRAVG